MGVNPSFVDNMSSDSGRGYGGSSNSYQLARVAHIVQGPYLVSTDIPDKLYKNATDLGTITYQLIDSDQAGTNQSNGNPPAKPIFSALKHVPVEGEFVLIIRGPSTAMNNSRDSADYFYLPPFNLWNAANHNALPDLRDYQTYVNGTVRSYNQSSTTDQPVNLTTTSSLIYPLTSDFVEKSDIKTLEQFTGDVTLEGRWGNSIRLGSTSLQPDINYWSATGSAGSPITIIRNGQGLQENKIPWFPTIENINVDPSSIYLTNGQKIVIDDIDNNFSLASLGIEINSTITTAIPIQQQLTSFSNLSPNEQDERIKNLNS